MSCPVQKEVIKEKHQGSLWVALTVWDQFTTYALLIWHISYSLCKIILNSVTWFIDRLSEFKQSVMNLQLSFECIAVLVHSKAITHFNTSPSLFFLIYIYIIADKSIRDIPIIGAKLVLANNLATKKMTLTKQNTFHAQKKAILYYKTDNTTKMCWHKRLNE